VLGAAVIVHLLVATALSRMGFELRSGAEASEAELAVRLVAPEATHPVPPPIPMTAPPPTDTSLVIDLPVVTSAVATSPAEAPIPNRSIAAPQAGPVELASELAVACPERQPPRYPPDARRRRQQGTVVLRVALDSTGQVSDVSVVSSSGSRVLDDAGVEAIRHWRCIPAERDGHPVGAIATQALEFVLERR
jgi:protein TonB